MFRATKIQAYVRFMEGRGVSSAKFLADTGIDATHLSRQGFLVSLEQYHHVITNMMKLSKDSGIAFSLGELADFRDLGITGYAMISASSLRQALDVWLKYSSSLIGTPIHTDAIIDREQGYDVIFSTPSRVSIFQQFEMEELIVQASFMIRQLTGIKQLYGKAEFSYPRPPHFELYEKLLRCPIEFDAPKIAIRVTRPNLETPVKSMNEEVFSICMSQCHQVMRALSDGDLLCAQLRDIFLRSPNNLPDLDTAAGMLGLSGKTLYRQLVDIDKSYQATKDEFRYDLACEYFKSGHMSPKQVGYLLGFSSPSNFSRAFRNWSGITIKQFMTKLADKKPRSEHLGHSSTTRRTL